MQLPLHSHQAAGGRVTRFAFLVAAAIAAVHPVRAADAPGTDAASEPPVYAAPREDVASPITDRFYLRASYFYPRVTTLLRVDPARTSFGGTTLSGERDFGWSRDNPDGRLELMFRLRERSRLRVDYLQLDRSSTVMLNRTIIFGNEVFTVNSQTDTSLNWRTLGFTYTYAFLQNDRFELGAGLGVHLLEIDALGQVPALLERHETSVGIGIPTLAVDGIWRISRRFAFTGRAQYLGGAVHGYSGSFGDYHGDFQYRWRKNFALGLGYSYVRASYQSVGHSDPGRFTLALQGPEAFVRVSF